MKDSLEVSLSLTGRDFTSSLTNETNANASGEQIRSGTSTSSSTTTYRQANGADKNLVNEHPVPAAVRLAQDVSDSSKISSSTENPPEQNPLQLTNLAALDIWKSYIEEGEKSDNDAAQGYWSQFKEALETSFKGRGRTERDDSVRGWANEKALVSEVEKILKEGTALTIHSALYLIEQGMVALPKKGAAHIRERARAYLGYDRHSDPGLISRLIRYTKEVSPDSAHAKSLLEETFTNLESKDSSVQTAFAIYSLVNQLSPQAEIQQETQGHLNALQGHSSFKRAAEKFLYSLSPTEVAVNVGLMFVSGGLGNLAKLLAMKKFEQAGVVGLKAIAGATGAGLAVEMASLGTFNNLQQVLTHDPSKMTAKNIADNYKKAASMIGFTKLFGNIGGIAAPNLAKGFRMAPQEGLTLGGKAFTWGVGHTAGLSGMIASSRFNQARGWQQAPVGGENEALMNDFLGYVEFAGAQGMAHSAVDAITQGKLSEFQQKQQQEITKLTAKLMPQVQGRLSPSIAALRVGAAALFAPELAYAMKQIGESGSAGSSTGFLASLATLTIGALGMAASESGENGTKIPLAEQVLQNVQEKKWVEAFKAVVHLSDSQAALEILLKLKDSGLPLNVQMENFITAILKRIPLDPEWAKQIGKDFFETISRINNKKNKKSIKPLAQKIEKIYKKYAALREPLADTGWSKIKIYKLFSLLETFRKRDAINTYKGGPGRRGESFKEYYSMLERDMDPAGRDYTALLASLKVMKEENWSPEQKYQCLFHLAKIANFMVAKTYNSLPTALSGLRDTNWNQEQKWHSLIRLAEKTGEEVWLSYNLLGSILSQALAPKKGALVQNFQDLHDHLTDYNRRRVLDLLVDSKRIFERLDQVHFPEHFALYVTLFERWPRLGYNLLEGILEATRKGTIPKDLAIHREKILHFIEKTNGFIPALYVAYLQEGEALFPKLEVHVDMILKDQFGMGEARRVIQENGEEFLLALIQMTSPTSGASFVKKEEQLGLLREMLKAGNLRDHIPEKWRGVVKDFLMSQGDWKLKAGESSDPEAKIKSLLDQFRVSEGKEKIEQEALVDVLTEYLQSDRSAEARNHLQEVLYEFAGQNDALREKIDRIQDNDYSTLILLEQLFGDKDNLQKILAEALEKLPEELLAAKAAKRKIEGDAHRLVKSLKKVWGEQIGGQDITEDKRIEILGSILKAYETDDIESKILNRPDVSEGLKEVIRQVMDLAPTLSKKQIIAEILAEPIELIQKEKSKFAYQDQGTLKVGLRAVKGPAYGLNGLSSGVCTATDLELWKNPNFKLLAITDENKGQVVGYIHVFETQINGKKYLTLPGINPSAEFLGTVDAKKLYTGLMEKVIEFAKAGDYDGVYIPTDPIIHSNRSDIQKAIKQAKYPIKNIPKVKWNTLPNPYPFTEVYKVWERTADQGSKGLSPLGGAGTLATIVAAGTDLATFFGADLAHAADKGSSRSTDPKSLLMLGGGLTLSVLAAWAAKKWVFPKPQEVQEKPTAYGNTDQAEMAQRLAKLRAKYINKKLPGKERRLAFAEYLQWIRNVPTDWQKFIHQERATLYAHFKDTPHNSEGVFFAALKHMNVQLGLDVYVNEEVDPPEWEWISLAQAKNEENTQHLSSEGWDLTRRNAIAEILTGNAATIQGEEVYYFLEDESIGKEAGPHRFTLEVHIDPDSGKPLAIGRYRRIPREIQRQTVSIKLYVQALPEDLQNFPKDFVVHIADIIMPSFLPMKVKNLWASLVGHPFEKPQQDNFPEKYNEDDDE
jgi:hypothetical protein